MCQTELLLLLQHLSSRSSSSSLWPPVALVTVYVIINSNVCVFYVSWVFVSADSSLFHSSFHQSKFEFLSEHWSCQLPAIEFFSAVSSASSVCDCHYDHKHDYYCHSVSQSDAPGVRPVSFGAVKIANCIHPYCFDFTQLLIKYYSATN